MSFIPYGHQWIDEDDIEEVVKVLRSDWITTGPKIEEFENAHDWYGPDASWAYDTKYLGRNYRITDFQVALGISQLKRLDER